MVDEEWLLAFGGGMGYENMNVCECVFAVAKDGSVHRIDRS